MYRRIINATEANEDNAPVVSRGEKLLCATKDGAEAIKCLLETMTGDSFDIFFHDADFEENWDYQEKWEIFQVEE